VEAAGVGEPASVTAVTKETGEYYFLLPGSSFDMLCCFHSKKDRKLCLSQGYLQTLQE